MSTLTWDVFANPDTSAEDRRPQLPALSHAPDVFSNRTSPSIPSRRVTAFARPLSDAWHSQAHRLYAIDPEVAQLPDDGEECLDRFVGRLRRKDDGLAMSLFRLVCDAKAEADARSLALEALSMARVTRYERLLAEAILTLAKSPDPALRFSAVAAASDVSAQNRTIVRRAIEERVTASEPRDDIRRAAHAFLAADSALRR